MYISKAFIGCFSLFLGVALFAFVTGTLSAPTVLAQPVDAGREPTGAPIVYNLTPAEDVIVGQDELSRAAATIETQREDNLSWAGSLSTSEDDQAF
jgi:hypothetical protein